MMAFEFMNQSFLKKVYFKTLFIYTKPAIISQFNLLSNFLIISASRQLLERYAQTQFASLLSKNSLKKHSIKTIYCHY